MISIIVPVYKVELYLHQCIKSILQQTHRDIEILLIDDGSPDQCGIICNEYAKTDRRIRVFHTENRGLSAARNLGLREAKGEYIGFVDSDDWIEPDMYEVLLRQLEDNSAEVSACGVWREYVNKREDIEEIRNATYKGREILQALIHNSINNGVWNKLYKREVFNFYSFPENNVYEDIATIYKVFSGIDVLSSTSNHLYHYRMRDKSIAHSWPMNTIIDYWNAYYFRYLDLIALPDIRSNRDLTDKLEEQLAIVSVTIYRHMHNIPKKQRAKQFLCMVSRFVRTHYPLFGNRKWKSVFRIRFFLTWHTHTNDILYTLQYTLQNRVLKIRNTKKIEFPAT